MLRRNGNVQFGTRGTVVTDFGRGGTGGWAMALQGDGKILLVGNTGYDVALARYQGDSSEQVQTSHFVDRFYQDLLERGPDSGGRAFWLSQLVLGATRAQVAQGFLDSLEYHTNQLDDLYATLLGRMVDPLRQKVFAPFLAAGGSIEEVEQAILFSEEYFRRAGGSVPGKLLAE